MAPSRHYRARTRPPAMDMEKRILVGVVQQGVWDMALESMPLAAGYLKSTALADDRIRREADIRIFNFGGGTSISAMATEIFSERCPQIFACSVLGWNFRAFGSLAETYKRMNPDGWVVFGGTHVAHQAERVFRLFPAVDVIVNGEGELVFRDLVNAHLDGRPVHDLGHIEGISFRDTGQMIHTTAPRERIENLDVIPSPILSGALDMVDAEGRFRYDVALMETNRGCPYKCSFCFWGGAVGQRVKAFSRERLRAELEVFAKLQVETIALCDANFGMLPIDEEFVDDLIEIRDRYGYPRALESSWAKNKSKVFYSIVRKMKRAGLRSSFTLSLQTLSDEALSLMNRRNMKVNDWEDLVTWLNAEGLECYAELIWGAPGETVESFYEGYDRLASRIARIAVYPLLLLPNTEYYDKRDEHGIVAVRGDTDDFEYSLAHNTISFAENLHMQKFMFWARVMAEYTVLRHAWAPLRVLGGLSQSGVLRNIQHWMEETDDPAAEPLRALLLRAAADQDAYGPAVAYLLSDGEAKRLLTRWWNESMRPVLPPEAVPVLDDIFQYDLLTHPILRRDDVFDTTEALPMVRVGNDDYFLRSGLKFEHDVPAILDAMRTGEPPDLSPFPVTLDLYYRTGFENFLGTTNHEEIIYFMGMSRRQIDAATPPPAVEAGSPALG
ncbi:KedN5 family methylcobalamin-dependent radical SAM C-methyltransferase [Sphaerisporangium viridialbum]|uniref:KedN5 family methylcobalamin-dependent radical SAM C-methyltransferase n=1 Tax=Sphaerisporangium viridialbum TaxID=46189 RepID=UPI003C734BD0